MRVRQVPEHDWRCPNIACRRRLGPGCPYIGFTDLDLSGVLSPAQMSPSSFESSYQLGSCENCRSLYCGALVMMVNAELDPSLRKDWLWQVCEFQEWYRYFEVESRGASWRFDRTKTSLGPADSHSFGPYLIEAGRHWFSALQERVRVSWDDLRLISRTSLQRGAKRRCIWIV